MAETFTDFMVRTMAGEDNVRRAVVILDTKEGIASFVWTPEELGKQTTLLGLLRFTTLAAEHDLVESWKHD